MENALAADRERHWKPHSGPESESESTEGRGAITRPRSRKASGVASRNLKDLRKRGDTVTSNRTTNSRGGGDSTDTTRGDSEKSPKSKEPRTPTRADHAHADLPPSPLPPTTTATATTGSGSSKKNNDDASIAESSTAASLDRPRTTTPVTPALTPALTGTTDDSDTDFQSAYSATPSPRESLRSNFDYDRIGASDTLHAVEKQLPGAFDAPKAGIVRERVSSIMTAMPQTSPTFSDDTVVSGRGAVSRR